MSARVQHRNRRLAFEQLERRQLLHGGSADFLADWNPDELSQLDDPPSLVLHIDGVRPGSDFDGLREDGDGLSQVEINWLRTEDYWQNQAEFGQNWDDQGDEDASDVDGAGGEVDQDRDGDTGSNPLVVSTDQDIDEPVAKSLPEDAATGEGENKEAVSEPEGVPAHQDSVSPMPATSVIVQPLGMSDGDASEPFAPSSSPLDEKVEPEPVSTNDAGLAATATLVRDRSNHREEQIVMATDQPLEPRALATGAVPDPSNSTTASSLPSALNRNHDPRLGVQVRSMATGLVGNFVPGTDFLLAAGSPDGFAAIDAAMNELLQDLDEFRTDANAVFESTPISTWVLSATAGLIAAELIRRRRRRALSDIVDDQWAVWMYPECTGFSGT